MLQNRPFDTLASNRVGTVADDYANVMTCGGSQAVRHCVGIRVHASSDVLKVDDEKVNPVKHGGRWFSRIAVQRINWDIESWMMSVTGFDHVVLNVGIKPMLGTEQGDERCIR